MQEGGPSAGVADAIAEGIMMSIDDAFQVAQDPEIVTPHVRDITFPIRLSVGLVFPVRENISFEARGQYAWRYVEVGDRVLEGDILARVSYDNDLLELDLAAARLRLNQFEESFNNTRLQRRMELARAQEDFDFADEDNMARAALQLARAELNYERFLFESANARRGFQEAVDNISDTLAGPEMIAPVDGMILTMTPGTTSTTTDDRGRTTSNHTTTLSIIDDEVFFFQITGGQNIPGLPAMFRNSILRYGDEIVITSTQSIRDGDDSRPVLEFNARIVSDPWGAGRRGSPNFWVLPVDMESFLIAVYELDPETPVARTINGMTFFTEFEMTLASNAIVLPIPAINAEDRRNYVFVNNDGHLGKRFVSTGVAMAGYIHITSGIELGTEVVILP